MYEGYTNSALCLYRQLYDTYSCMSIPGEKGNVSWVQFQGEMG